MKCKNARKITSIYVQRHLVNLHDSLCLSITCGAWLYMKMNTNNGNIDLYIWSIRGAIALMQCIGIYLSPASGLMSSQDGNIIGHS